MNHFFTTYRENLHPMLKKEFVVESLEFILKNNTVIFFQNFFWKLNVILRRLFLSQPMQQSQTVMLK